MKLKIISCEILYRELCLLIAESPHTCDVEFLPKGLHDLGVDKMVPRLQARIDEADTGDYDAILLGYALCNNGVLGLSATRTPLVVPRAHDCIALFLGSRLRHREYSSRHPDTYYLTTGWIERNDASSAGDETIQQKLGLFMQYEELVEKYGEDNAGYIMETMGDATANYSRLAFIRMGLHCEEPFRQAAAQRAQQKGWTFEEVEGSLGLLRKLTNGNWDDDFLVLQPGETLQASYDDGVMRTCPMHSRAEGCTGCK